MEDWRLREYAETLIREHAQEVEWLSIFERAEECLIDGEISGDDAHKVHALISRARVTVSWD
jgi:hypothetical protein